MKPAKPDFDAPDLTFDAPVSLDFDPAAPAAQEGKRPPAAVALGLVAKETRQTERNAARQMTDLVTTTAARDHFDRLPKPGQSLHLILPGTYTTTDLVIAAQRILKHPVDLTLATLSTSTANAGRLLDELDAGTVRRLDLLLSDYFAKADPDQFAAIRDRMTARGCRVKATRTHAKVALIRAGWQQRLSEHRPEAKPTWLVIEGSGNLRSCNALEQATIFNSRSLYEFHRTWMDRLLDQP